MTLKLTIPARINILGNPSDGNEGDFSTISAAVNIFAGAFVQEASTIRLQTLAAKPNDATSPSAVLDQVDITPSQLPFTYDGRLDLQKAAFNRLYQFSPEFRAKLEQKGVQISYWSEVPRQSGLGGSSLFVLLTLGALREFYSLDRHFHNDYILSELTQRVESLELHITCGFADRYVPLFGGLAYLDYRGKLNHLPIGKEPFVAYERLDPWVADLPLIAISTGIPHDSGDVHGRMRPRYLEEYEQWSKLGGNPPPMLQFMTSAWQTAWQGKIAMLANDLETFGVLMNQNHRVVDQMMQYCGFGDGAGWANNLLIQTALQNGALGAKLTGAGSGGSVFALTRPGEEDQVIGAWKREIENASLTSAYIYQPKISKIGLFVQRTE
jgi:galactokinase/mevalonate kinase-like predicted kinase